MPSSDEKTRRERVEIDTSRPSSQIADLEARIQSRIIGQERAVRMAARALEIDDAGLTEPGMPAAILFFAGPPGVGKTELIMVLSEEWIGKLARRPGEPVIPPATIIDCTFFRSSHDIANLKGSTKGYVGYEDEVPLHQHALDRYHMEVALHEEKEQYLADKAARLDRLGKLKPNQKVGLTLDEAAHISRRVFGREEPFKKVLLFDEITRAHPSLWEFLISLMNGKPLSMSDGTMTDLTRTVLGMTSNINEREIQAITKGARRGIGFRPDLFDMDPEKRDEIIYESTKARIEKWFPPPFVSRIKKNIVVFRLFRDEDWLKIIDLRLSEVESLFRLGNPAGRPILHLRFTPECRRFLLEQGIDRQYGARPLRDTIRRHLLVPLARVLNGGRLQPEDTLIFEREPSKSGKKDDDRIVVYKENPSAPST